MSDCSSSAMEPRTCGTCKNVRYTLLDCFHAANDERYYMRCTKPNAMACEHYVDDPDSPQHRYERLAQVALEMYEWADGITHKTWTIVPERVDGFREELEALGVSVDD